MAQNVSLMILKYYDPNASGKKNLENTIEARNNKLEELELFNKLTIGRELKMIELKKEINEMMIQSGHSGKYKIADDNDKSISQKLKENVNV